jgi:hypothetical protein
MGEFVTLRSHLIGSLSDLVESASLSRLGTPSIVCQLVSLFVDYEEEGASLFLDAFLTDNLESLTAPLPRSACLRLGIVQCDEAGVQKAVKKTAPLVRGCWKMFFCLKGQLAEFGLFRDSGHPLNVPVDLILRQGASSDAKFIRITRLAKDSVRVSTQYGTQTIVNFTNSKEGAGDASRLLLELSEVICSDLNGNVGESCKTYLLSLLSRAVRESHGSLIAVSDDNSIPNFLRDCTPLKPPINLKEAVESVLRDPDAIPELHALESIVTGMFCSDGIVLFDSGVNVLGYNAFIKIKSSSVSGGARRRAYLALCDKVGTGLKAVFFQSQDGSSDLKRSS